MSVTYTAVLEFSEDSVLFLSALLHAERVRRGTRKDRRALGTYKQAVLVLRWFLEDARMRSLARDNSIALSTAYDYRDEGIAVLAARQPSLHGALLAAKAAGHSHVIVDGTLVHTDRVSTPGPTPGVDLWWSGKHHHHGGNIQVVSAPDGWPLWTSDVRPGREHDMTAARADPELLARIADWVSDGQLALADLGYEGRTGDVQDPVQETEERRAHHRPADLQRRPRRAALPRRTRELPAQDHLQSATPLPRLPLATRRCRRRRAGPAPPRARPHHMINNIDHTP